MPLGGAPQCNGPLLKMLANLTIIPPNKLSLGSLSNGRLNKDFWVGRFVVFWKSYEKFI